MIYRLCAKVRRWLMTQHKIKKLRIVLTQLLLICRALQGQDRALVMVILTLIDSLSSEDGFYPMLFKQVNLTFTDPAERIIATHFINALEPTGWISSSVESIAQESGCSVEQAETVLVAALQGFEPAGLFARDLAECLKIQLIETEQFTPYLASFWIIWNSLAEARLNN